MPDALELVTVALRVTLVLGAAWLVTRTLRNASASARHVVWTCAVVAALLVPPLSQLPAWRVALPVVFESPAVVPAEDGAWTMPDAPAPMEEAVMPARTATSSREAEPVSIALADVAVAVWFCGAAIVLLYMALGMVATRRLRRTATRPVAGWVDEARVLAASMGIARVTFAESNRSSVPFACGVVNPLVVVPSTVASWSPERLRVVLLHELAHIRRRDCLTQLLARFACAIYWFHPLAWLTAYGLRVERERACDDIVLGTGVRGSDYATHLVEMARSTIARPPLVAAGSVAMAHPSQLEGRLMSILDPHTQRTSPPWARLAVTAFALSALTASSLRLEAARPAQGPAQAAAPAASKVTFEVASIRRNTDEEARRTEILLREPNAPIAPGRAQTAPGGRLMGRAMSVREMIRDAYGYRNRAAADVIGGPAWIDSERYDVQAKADVEFPGSTILGLPPIAETAFRALLGDRMKLQVRLESQRRRVYEMVLDREDKRLGPNLTPSKGGCRSFYTVGPVFIAPAADGEKPAPPPRTCQMGVSLAQVTAENMTMEEWARFLAAFPQIDATVIDRTGVTGAFDFKITNPAAGEPGASQLLPAVQPLLESQLGLKLRPTEAPIEVLIIERVERPTEN